jgi:hypothetical protein
MIDSRLSVKLRTERMTGPHTFTGGHEIARRPRIYLPPDEKNREGEVCGESNWGTLPACSYGSRVVRHGRGEPDLAIRGFGSRDVTIQGSKYIQHHARHVRLTSDRICVNRCFLQAPCRFPPRHRLLFPTYASPSTGSEKDSSYLSRLPLRRQNILPILPHRLRVFRLKHILRMCQKAQACRFPGRLFKKEPRARAGRARRAVVRVKQTAECSDYGREMQTC